MCSSWSRRAPGTNPTYWPTSTPRRTRGRRCRRLGGRPTQAVLRPAYLVFFFIDTATTEIYTSIDTLSLTTLFRSRHLTRNHVSRPAQSGPQSGSSIGARSEEHTSELQSPIDISYAVFCLKKKK